MEDTELQSLGCEDPLEKEMATHSSIFVWKIPWTEEPGKLQFKGLRKYQTWLSDWTTKISNRSVILKKISVIISFSSKTFHNKFLSKWKLPSCVWVFVTPIDCMSMGFSRQLSWGGFPFPPPGDLHNPGTEPTSPTSPAPSGWFFTTEPPEKPRQSVEDNKWEKVINKMGTFKTESLFE